MTTQTPRTFRADQQVVRNWLERLDRRTSAPALEYRASSRYRYRQQELALEVCGSDEAVRETHRATPRNISRDGAALLVGQFIYPQTMCRIRLCGHHGAQEALGGRVVRCRYLLGSGSLYEVGVRFERPVDVGRYAPQARRLRLLLIDQRAETGELITQFLTGFNVELHALPDWQSATDAPHLRNVDVVLLDLDTETGAPFETARGMRRTGYVGPIIGLTLHGGADLRRACQASGCTGYLMRPILRADLHGLLAALLDPPLVSSLATEPDLAPLVDRFVAGLRDRATGLMLAAETGDRAAVEQILRELQAGAGSYGFAEITEEAAFVLGQLAMEPDDGALLAALRQLIHLCLKARPATPPSELAFDEASLAAWSAAAAPDPAAAGA